MPLQVGQNLTVLDRDEDEVLLGDDSGNKYWLNDPVGEASDSDEDSDEEDETDAE